MTIRKIKLEFVRQPTPAWIGQGLLVAAAIIASLMIVDFLRVQRAVGDLEMVLGKLERKAKIGLQNQDVVQADTQAALAQVQLAKSRVERLSMPWDRFFRVIDDMRHEDVALLSVEPDMDSGIVRVGAEARDVPSMLAYINQLRENAVLPDAVVVNHQILQQVQFKPVRFSFVGTWKDRP